MRISQSHLSPRVRALSKPAPSNETAASDRNIFALIESRRDRMRPSHGKVADEVLRDWQFVVDGTLAAVAQRAAVSEPTVIRFCREIGCSGFRELKIRLAKSIAFGLPATSLVLSLEDRTETVSEKIFDSSLSSIDRCRRHLDLERIQEAVDLLVKARHIEFFGYGASGIVAQDAQQKFALFGCTCSYQIDSHQQYIAASMMREGDVAVAISNTGTTRSVIEFARTARLGGARVIAISGSDSPIIEQCDVGLVVETLENTELYTPMISRLAMLIVIDILATSVAIKHGSAHSAKINEMKKGLATMRALNL